MKSPSWTRQQNEALETAEGSDHGPTIEESSQAANTDDPKGRERVSPGGGNRRTAQHGSIDEHRLFLQGLDTPAQLASHAQKLFRRMDSPDKAKMRLSINDITNLDERKIINQQMATTESTPEVTSSYLVDAGVYASSDTTGIDLLFHEKAALAVMGGKTDATCIDPPVDDESDSSASQGQVVMEEKNEATGIDLSDVNKMDFSIPQEPAVTKETIEATGVDGTLVSLSVSLDGVADQRPSAEEITEAVDSDEQLDSLLAWLNDVHSYQGPTPGEIFEPTAELPPISGGEGIWGRGFNFWQLQQNVSALEQLPPVNFATYSGDGFFDSHENISATEEPPVEEMGACAGDYLCELQFTRSENGPNPEGPMTGLGTENAEGVGAAGGVNLWGCRQNNSALEEPPAKEIGVCAGDYFSEFPFSSVSDPLNPQGATTEQAARILGVTSGVNSSEWHENISAPANDTDAYLGNANAEDANNTGVYFWECPSPYPPNFGACGSESASDAALLETPPSPCPFSFDCAGSLFPEASRS